MLSLLTAVPIAAFALTPSEVFEQVKDSVVVVRALDAQGKPTSQGSGVMLPTGQIATNCHVIKTGMRFQVGRGKRFLAAELGASNGDKDLCLLEAKGLSGKPVALRKAATLKVDEAVYAVDSPQGLELSLSSGIVSQLRGGLLLFIPTKARSPDSSGGGLFDTQGRLVGITADYVEAGQSRLNFALPVEWLAEIKPGRTMAAVDRPQWEWLARAVALEHRKDWPKFLRWSQQWTSADPDNADAWTYLALAYNHHKRRTDAIDAYRRALRIRPHDVENWSLLVNAYENLYRYTDTILGHNEALRRIPYDADSFWHLGKVYEDAGRFTHAVSLYTQALKIQPNHDLASYGLARAYALSGDREAALAAAKDLRRNHPALGDKLANEWFLRDVLIPR